MKKPLDEIQVGFLEYLSFLGQIYLKFRESCFSLPHPPSKIIENRFAIPIYPCMLQGLELQPVPISEVLSPCDTRNKRRTGLRVWKFSSLNFELWRKPARPLLFHSAFMPYKMPLSNATDNTNLFKTMHCLGNQYPCPEMAI